MIQRHPRGDGLIRVCVVAAVLLAVVGATVDAAPALAPAPPKDYGATHLDDTWPMDVAVDAQPPTKVKVLVAYSCALERHLAKPSDAVKELVERRAQRAMDLVSAIANESTPDPQGSRVRFEVVDAVRCDKGYVAAAEPDPAGAGALEPSALLSKLTRRDDVEYSEIYDGGLGAKWDIVLYLTPSRIGFMGSEAVLGSQTGAVDRVLAHRDDKGGPVEEARKLERDAANACAVLLRWQRLDDVDTPTHWIAHLFGCEHAPARRMVKDELGNPHPVFRTAVDDDGYGFRSPKNPASGNRVAWVETVTASVFSEYELLRDAEPPDTAVRACFPFLATPDRWAPLLAPDPKGGPLVLTPVPLGETAAAGAPRAADARTFQKSAEHVSRYAGAKGRK